MARTALTVVDLNKTHPGGSKAITYVAADIVNLNSFILTGREVLLINDTATGGTVTISSSPDSFGRTGDLVLTIGAGLSHAIAFMDKSGWVQSGGVLHLEGSAVTLEFAVVRLPG